MSSIENFLRFSKVDFQPKHRQPLWGRWMIATLIALIASLVADAILVKIGTRLFPGTQGYVHFQFSAYAKLTILGVVGASIGWPIITRISSAPKWLYLRLAIVVTIIVFLPDFYILCLGQPFDAVLVLLCMHVAIALVTYNAMVRIAPILAMRGAHHARLH